MWDTEGNEKLPGGERSTQRRCVQHVQRGAGVGQREREKGKRME